MTQLFGESKEQKTKKNYKRKPTEGFWETPDGLRHVDGGSRQQYDSLGLTWISIIFKWKFEILR